MNRMMVLLVLAAGLSGCTNPMNLTYDFGRAYAGAFQAQADLTRSTVAAAQYRLSGLEGTSIRLRVRDDTTDAESQKTVMTAGSN